MELHPTEGVEPKHCLYNRFGVPYHTGSERATHRRAQELRVGENTPTHLNKTMINVIVS